MAKTGAQHLESLRDGREVFLNGEKVDDVTTHPAYKNAVAAAANLYDFQADPENIEWMTFESPTSGERSVEDTYPEDKIRHSSSIPTIPHDDNIPTIPSPSNGGPPDYSMQTPLD